MNKKNNILNLHLEDLGIRSVTNWVKRCEKAWEAEYRLLCEKMQDKPAKEFLSASTELVRRRIVTVACLVRVFPYRFDSYWVDARGKKMSTGLGPKPTAELKKTLLKLGLTPDEWPALADREFFIHLSRWTLLTVPIVELFRWIRPHEMASYLKCKVEDLGDKTLKEFLAINPLTLEGGRKKFFNQHQRQLVTVRQNLIAKGFSTRDGVFFKWNPERDSLRKARKILQAYGEFFPAELETVAQILVAERFVI